MAYPNKPKQYKVDVRAFDTPEASLTFVIDYSRLDEELAQAIVGFHSGDDDILHECSGNLQEALVFKTVQCAYWEMIKEDINAFGLNCYFDKEEGWPGEGMIKFIKATYEQPEITLEDLDITETEVEN